MMNPPIATFSPDLCEQPGRDVKQSSRAGGTAWVSGLTLELESGLPLRWALALGWESLLLWDLASRSELLLGSGSPLL